MIKKEGGKFVLFSKDGSKKLGTFDTKEEAKKREREILGFKRRKESGTFRILEAASNDGSTWEVVLIESGLSANDIDYPEEPLEKSVPLFEGLKAYAYEFKGDTLSLFDHLPDNVRENNKEMTKNLVGYYDKARFGEFDKPDGTKGKGILAKFNVTANWLKETLKNAWQKNKKDLIGFSIDAMANVKETFDTAGKSISELVAFDKIDEVTVVTEPGAGGRVLRLAASNKKLKETHAMKEILKWLKENFPKLAETIKEDATPEKLQEAITGVFAKIKEGYTEPKLSEPAKTPVTVPGLTIEQVTAKFEEWMGERNKTAVALQESQAMFKKKVTESKLPDAIKTKLTNAHPADKVLDEAGINHVLKLEQDAVASLQESGLLVPGQEQNVQVNEDEYTKLQKAMDGMMLGEDIDGIPRFWSLHESYRKITGYNGTATQMGKRILQETAFSLPPTNFADDFSPHEVSDGWRKHLRESSIHTTDLKRITEATTLLTTTWTEMFGDSVRRKMMLEYNRPGLQVWRKLVGANISSVPDFRTNRRLRVGGFGNLATVSENGTYQYIDLPTDQEVTYAVAKRGNLYSISMEAMVNDDLKKVKSLIGKIGEAAVQTLHDFVFAFLTDNGNMDYDSVALFHSSSHGANKATTALGDDSLADRTANMKAQTEQDSGKIIGAPPKFLFIPPELERIAWDITHSAVSLSAGRAETVPSFHRQFAIEPVLVLNWTDANDWYLAADSSKFPTIEIAFLNGREEPEIFIQDQPTIGSVFTADKITVKVRHIYGGKPLDHRFLDWSEVS